MISYYFPVLPEPNSFRQPDHLPNELLRLPELSFPAAFCLTYQTP